MKYTLLATGPWPSAKVRFAAYNGLVEFHQNLSDFRLYSDKDCQVREYNFRGMEGFSGYWKDNLPGSPVMRFYWRKSIG